MSCEVIHAGKAGKKPIAKRQYRVCVDFRIKRGVERKKENRGEDEECVKGDGSSREELEKGKETNEADVSRKLGGKREKEQRAVAVEDDVFTEMMMKTTSKRQMEEERRERWEGN